MVPHKRYGWEWLHMAAARQSQPLHRGTHAARPRHGTSAQVQPAAHIRERLELLITHLNKERTGKIFLLEERVHLDMGERRKKGGEYRKREALLPTPG